MRKSIKFKSRGEMMLTCYLKNLIDPYKLKEFENCGKICI